MADLNSQALILAVPELLQKAATTDKIRFVMTVVEQVSSADDLRALALKVRDGLGETALAVLFAVIDDKPVVIAAASKAAVESGAANAGSLVKTASTILGGGGGGKPDLAQGGGTNALAIDSAIAELRKMVG